MEKEIKEEIIEILDKFPTSISHRADFKYTSDYTKLVDYFSDQILELFEEEKQKWAEEKKEEAKRIKKHCWSEDTKDIANRCIELF